MKSKPVLLDTHVWIWLMMGDSSLNTQAKKFIESVALISDLYISAISCWEIAMLEAKGRIILGMPCLEWITQSLTLSGIQVCPISPEIAVESCHLPEGFHGDPADRLIVASARIHNLTLVTQDKLILDYAGGKHLTVFTK